MSDDTLEGWFTDPYERHEARWLSDGTATRLVRDGARTSYDDPPPGPWVGAPTRVEADPASTEGSDLIRADDAEGGEPYDAKKATWAVYDQLAVQVPSAFDDVSPKRRSAE